MLNFREQSSTACFETSTIAVTLYICESKPRVGSYMLELVERDRYYTSDMYDLTCVHIAISPAPTTCVLSDGQSAVLATLTYSDIDNTTTGHVDVDDCCLRFRTCEQAIKVG